MSGGIEIRGLSWKYDDKEALSDIRTDFLPGGFNIILGPNGSGKTTLLNLISRTLKPPRGSVIVDGADVLELPGRAMAKRISYVAQTNVIDYSFTVLDIVMMGRYPHLRRFAPYDGHDKQIALEAMRNCGVSEFSDRKVNTLSGGELQRVMIARALAQQADIMLLDEPISHLDIRHQSDIMRLIGSLCAGGGLTAVCVLHDLDISAYFADKIILLSEGRIYADGTPVDVLNNKNISDVYKIDSDISRENDRLRISINYGK